MSKWVEIHRCKITKWDKLSWRVKSIFRKPYTPIIALRLSKSYLELSKENLLKQLGYHSLAYTKYDSKTKRFTPDYSYIDDLRIITNEVR
jgi:hypothetical protein